MSADEPTNPCQQWPREVTREEALKLRAHYLALAQQAAASNRDDSESTDATVAAFILPGD